MPYYRRNVGLQIRSLNLKHSCNPVLSRTNIFPFSLLLIIDLFFMHSMILSFYIVIFIIYNLQYTIIFTAFQPTTMPAFNS